MQPEVVTVHQDPDELTAKVLVEGRATGVLMGGKPRHHRAVGGMDVSELRRRDLADRGRRQVHRRDRTLTQLLEVGCLEGLRGVAVGQFIRSAEERAGKWSIVDLLYDRLGALGVPVLGGLPIGHGADPLTIPLGTTATLDTTTRTLTVEPGVQ